jgi:hypothetical protein
MPMPRPVRVLAAVAVAVAFTGILLLAVFGFPVSAGFSFPGGPALAPVALAHHQEGCFLMFEEGRLEIGGPTGSQLLVPGDGNSIGGLVPPWVEHPIALLWPEGVSVRRSWFNTEIVDARGVVLARDGQRAHVGGGYGGAGFLACGEGATFPLP